MKNRAFTLIELLVVVLIIGVLAAIALPQYNKAVLKSRLAEGVIYARYLHDAQEMYYLANNEYASSFADLGIDATKQCPSKWSCHVDVSQVVLTYKNHPFSLRYNHNQATMNKGVFYCYAERTDAGFVNACKTMGPSWYSDTTVARHRIN